MYCAMYQYINPDVPPITDWQHQVNDMNVHAAYSSSLNREHVCEQVQWLNKGK